MIKLEAAAKEDLEQILRLQKEAFHDQALIYNDSFLPPLTQTIDEIKAESELKEIYKVVEDGKIIASVRCFIKDDSLHIEKLFVHPGYQNKGVGTQIMREIEHMYCDRVKGYELFTGEKSMRNLHVYRKLGYRETRRIPTSHGFDLIYMKKSCNLLKEQNRGSRCNLDRYLSSHR